MKLIYTDCFFFFNKRGSLRNWQFVDPLRSSFKLISVLVSTGTLNVLEIYKK